MSERVPQPVLSAEDAARVDAFVRRHFGLPGALRLHRHALGFDLLRAPANVALAPINLLLQLVALALRVVGARRAGRWVGAVALHLPSDVGRAVAAALERDLLAPRRGAVPATAAERRLVARYLAVRIAVAEITATLAVFISGAVLFGALTPGVMSLSPLVSDRAAEAMAIADFPLGEGLGRIWYATFGADRPGWLLAACTAALLVSATLLSAFAGILADPVQRATGIHHRRLQRLLARLDQADAEADDGVEREHLLARFGDVADAVASLLRHLRP